MIFHACIRGLHRWLQARRRVLILGVFSHVHIDRELVAADFLHRLIVVVLKRVLFLDTDLPWIDNYYVTIATLPCSC